MSNTVIQLKWSETTSTPPSLNVAEPAYSNTSNKLFIGLSDNTVVAVGGKYYTDIVDAATSSNTSSTLVKRDGDGGFVATYVKASLFGKANTADKWETARTLGVDGDATGTISVDGSANANIPLTLVNSGVTAGAYGGSTSVPTFTVDSKGRITYAANVSVATSLSFAGDIDTGSLSILTETFTITGGDGITTTANNQTNSIIVDVDNTVVKTDRTSQTINGDIAITGNLVVSGNTVSQDVTTVRTTDSLIKLANNNIADALDIGFYGEYQSGGVHYAGIIRDASDGIFKIFTGETTDPTNNVVSYGVENRGTLDTNIVGGNVSGLFSAIAVADGGTGQVSFTKGAIVVGDSTGSLKELANTGTAGTYGSASNTQIITTDAYGRVSGVTNSAIQIDASNIVSGKVAIYRGGTNNDTFTTGAGLFYDGSKFATLANSTYTLTGGLGVANTITSITADAYGRLTAVTGSQINIDASQVTSGTLTVPRGGTGVGSLSANGVVISGTTSTSAFRSVTSSTEGHILQINSSGVPTFAMLNGGSF